MAPNSKHKVSWERLDEQRIREAMKEIGRSSNLRYFLRNLLGHTGVHSILPSDNALSMARAAGRHEIGMTLIETMNQFQPDLWPNMLLEEQNELAQRASTSATYASLDRGEPESIADASSDNDY